MKNKIITICLILIVIVCIGITQLPGIYAVPTEYSDFEGIVISKDDNLYNKLPENILFSFRGEEDDLSYPNVDPNIICPKGSGSYGSGVVLVADYISGKKMWINDCSNGPDTDVPIPRADDYRNNPSVFWDYIFTFSKYWKVYSTEQTFYGQPILYLKPYNYIEPEYKIECNPTEIAPGETSQCELKVNYHSRIKSLNFKLDTDQYNISNVEAGEEFEDLQVSDGVYSLSSKSSLEDSEEGKTTTILSFVIKAEGNTISSADNIKVVDLEYHDELSESPKITASATVTQNKQEKTDIKNIINNPKTRNNILVIILLLTIIISSVLISNKNKEKGK